MKMYNLNSILEQKSKYSQLFVEFDGYNVHVDIYLVNFDIKNVNRILKNYIKKYDGKEINRLCVNFWEKGIAGDYLSFRRKNYSPAHLNKPLSGIKYIPAVYNYINTS